jgi:hypothetical protein
MAQLRAPAVVGESGTAAIGSDCRKCAHGNGSTKPFGYAIHAQTTGLWPHNDSIADSVDKSISFRK